MLPAHVQVMLMRRLPECSRHSNTILTFFRIGLWNYIEQLWRLKLAVLCRDCRSNWLNNDSYLIRLSIAIAKFVDDNVWSRPAFTQIKIYYTSCVHNCEWPMAGTSDLNMCSMTLPDSIQRDLHQYRRVAVRLFLHVSCFFELKSDTSHCLSSLGLWFW